MWGLVSIDLIPAGSLVAEYTVDLNDPYDDD